MNLRWSWGIMRGVESRRGSRNDENIVYMLNAGNSQ